MGIAAWADQLRWPGVTDARWLAGDRAVCEWRWAPAEDGTVLRGLDVYRVRDGRSAAKDGHGKITTGTD